MQQPPSTERQMYKNAAYAGNMWNGKKNWRSTPNAVATRTDFLVRGVIRGRRGLKISSKEMGRNVHAHNVHANRTFRPISLDRFFASWPKDDY